MAMGSSQIIDNLDSLWFFSNVFSSSTTTQEQVGLGDQEEEEEEEATKPMNRIEENSQNDLSLVNKCHKCGEFAAEIESLKAVVEELANKTEEKKKELASSSSNSSGSRSRRRRRNKRSNLLHDQRRQVFGDVGFYHNGQIESHSHVESPWLLLDDDDDHHHDFQNMKMKMKMKMPPLNDGMAMKQHLKSWAYAVACTVR